MADSFEKLVFGNSSGGNASADVPLFLQDSTTAPKGEFLASLDDAHPWASRQHPEAGAPLPSLSFGDPPRSAATQSIASTTAAAGARGDASGASSAAPLVLSSADKLTFTSFDTQTQEQTVYNLHRERILGKGNFGCATLYRNVGDGIRTIANPMIVVKDVNLQAMTSERAEEVDTLVNEIALLQEVKGHPNCLRIFDYFSSSSSPSSLTSTPSSPSAQLSARLTAFREALCDKKTKMAYLLTEFCAGGDLAAKLEARMNAHNTAGAGVHATSEDSRLVHKHNPRYFSETFIASVCIQLLVGLNHLHSDKKIIHRDIKPQNLFLREDGVSMRLGDFGIAYSEGANGGGVNYSLSSVGTPCRRMATAATAATATTARSGVAAAAAAGARPGTGGAPRPRKEVKGTPFYMAPELFQESSTYTYAVDVWSAGVLLYECIALEKPFLASSYPALSQLVVSGRCVSLRDRDELRRASGSGGGSSSSSVDKHLYHKDLLDVVMSMLTVDPALRPSVQRLLKKSFVRKHLWAVPQTILNSAAYRSIFGDEAIAEALREAAVSGFPGVPDVVDETGVPTAAPATLGRSANEADSAREQRAHAAADDEEEYEDDFESSEGDV